MMLNAIAAGVRAAAGRPGLVLLLWGWHTVLALVVTLPAWSRLRAATELKPGTDALRGGLDLGTLIELLQQEGAAVPALVTTVVSLVGVTLLSNAFLAGGILESLLGGDERPLMHRFFRGAGRFFFRSLSLLALTCLAGIVAAGLAAVAVSAALRPMTTGGWEAGSALAALLTLLVIGAIAGVFLLALDYARVLLVREDARSVMRTWLRALRFVVAHLVATGTIAIAFFGLVLAAVALGAWLPLRFGAAGWPAILSALVVQQACVAAWIAFRVAQIAAQAEFHHLATPEPVPEPEPVPPLPQEPANA